MSPTARARAWRTIALGLLAWVAAVVLMFGGFFAFVAHDIATAPAPRPGATAHEPATQEPPDIDLPEISSSGSRFGR